MDFVSDQLFDDRRFRVLVIIENFARERLALDANARIRGIDVVTTLERITREHGFPKRIKVDNGLEFISKDLDRWAYWNHVELDFSRPGKPSDNAPAEAFNSRFRQECLNQHWFLTMEDAKMKLSKWQSNNYQALGSLHPAHPKKEKAVLLIILMKAPDGECSERVLELI